MSEQKQITKQENKSVTYEVGGEQIKLNESIVSQFLARGSKSLTQREIVNFIQLCRYRKLNPFLNEAYPVKFGSEPAQLIVGADAFKRKAEENTNFAGYRAGIIIIRNKEVMELDGACKLPTDTLVGGWAEVYRKDRKYPSIAKVNFNEYNKNQSTWKQIPCTMIRKVAIVQALREAFPSDLGAMYSSEELGIQQHKKMESIKEEVEEEIKENANTETLGLEEDTEVVDAEVIENIEFEGDK